MEHLYKKIKYLGQSTIEYILLIALISSIAYTFLNSDKFKSLFGKDSALMAAQIKSIEFAYHHATISHGADDHLNFQKHQSFYNAETNSSRFFISKDAYGAR